jgi:DNA-binding FadR family transcriptional regulator
MIEVVNGKGAIIKPIDSDPLRSFFRRAIILDGDTIIELLEVRKGLEAQTASLAAERRTDDELAQLRQDVIAMRDTMYDPEECIEADLQFHLKIARATHNVMFYYLLESIRDSTKNTILEGRLSRKTDEELERVQVLHEMIYAAIEAGDAEQAARAMITHFDEAVLAVTRIKRPAAL